MNRTDDPIAEAIAELDALEAEGLAAFRTAPNPEAVEAARVHYLGMKQGKIRAAQERIKRLPPEAKRTYGQRFNAVKKALEDALEEARGRASQTSSPIHLLQPIVSIPPQQPWRGSGFFTGPPIPARALPAQPPIDVTLPGDLRHPKLRDEQHFAQYSKYFEQFGRFQRDYRPRLGHQHPLTQTAVELIDIWGRFGFCVARGPEVEDAFHNFEALNIPPTHPARDPADNFYLSDGALLRSQTSTVQIRVMERQPPPVRVIAIGRVYRPDAVDATHSFMFHQIEGLMVDRGVTMADLKTVLRLFAQSYLGADVKIRFRPSFFPFTEPSVEVDMLWHGGARWVEMGGAGMVDPHVFRAVGYNPEEVTGFAFGLGIERLCMRRHGIDDIRLLFQNDARFLKQF